MSAARATASLGEFVGVVGRPQTYQNLLYLALSFPLGLFYFVFLVTGYSVSLSLSVILVGLPMLAVMVVATLLLFAFEQELTAALLPGEFQRRPFPSLELSVENVREELLPASVVGFAFLVAKFAFGIGAFTLLVVSFVTSAVLVMAPLAVTGGIETAYVSLGVPESEVTYTVGPWIVDTLPEAAVVSLVGVVAMLASLHLVNLAATAYARTMRAVVTATTGDE
jgi:hypothetical protein